MTKPVKDKPTPQEGLAPALQFGPEFALIAGRRLRLRGERVAVAEAANDKDEISTEGIMLPQNRNKGHLVCKVVALGDGVQPSGEVKPIYPKIDDNVFIQFHPGLVKSNATRVGGVPMFLVHQHDCIARIDGKKLERTAFHPLGRWVLARLIFVDKEAGIWLPNNFKVHGNSVPQRFFFEEQGESANIEVKPGMEIFVDKSRANLIRFGKDDYVYLDRDSVAGVDPESLISDEIVRGTATA